MTITFKRQVNFVGRNGFFKSTGLDVFVDRQKGIVILSPITSRGAIGNCAIEIPLEEFSQKNMDVWLQLQAAKLS